MQQQVELLGEQLVVVVEVVPEERERMKDPRPAMISARPPDRRSSVAKSWNTRTGSSELITLTALVRRILLVRSAAAASTTAGVETAKSVVFPHAEHVQTDLVGKLDLLDEVADAAPRSRPDPCEGRGSAQRTYRCPGPS